MMRMVTAGSDTPCGHLSHDKEQAMSQPIDDHTPRFPERTASAVLSAVTLLLVLASIVTLMAALSS
jgi:hypothetical protein